MGNEYHVAGNFVGEQFLQILRIDYDSQIFSANILLAVVQHMVYNQCLPKSLPLQLVIERQR